MRGNGEITMMVRIGLYRHVSRCSTRMTGYIPFSASPPALSSWSNQASSPPLCPFDPAFLAFAGTSAFAFLSPIRGPEPEAGPKSDGLVSEDTDNLALALCILALEDRPSSAGHSHVICVSMQLGHGSGGNAPHFDFLDRHYSPADQSMRISRAENLIEWLECRT